MITRVTCNTLTTIITDQKLSRVQEILWVVDVAVAWHFVDDVRGRHDAGIQILFRWRIIRWRSVATVR